MHSLDITGFRESYLTCRENTNDLYLFADSLSILQALQTAKDKELNGLTTALTFLCRAHTVVLQLIPSHTHLAKAADTLAKEGSKKEQADTYTTFREAKTITGAKQHNKWLQQHPLFNKYDSYHPLTRVEQVITFTTISAITSTTSSGLAS